MRIASDYPDSYYAETLGAQPVRPVLTNKLNVDVCVIGAGLAGLTTALELVRQGKSVALFEAKRIGWGASGRNGGFVSAGFAGDTSEMLRRLGQEDGQAAFQLSVDGVEYVRRQIQDLQMTDVLDGEGYYEVYRYNDAQNAKQKCTVAKEVFGQDISYLNTKETREQMKSDRYHHAHFDPNAFHINPLRYCHGLAQEIERLGGHIFEDSKAEKLTRSGTFWKVSAHGGEVTSRHVVLCTSAYDFKLYPKVSRAMQPVATYVMTTQPMPETLDTAINTTASIADTRRAGDYYRRLPDGRLLWGGRITTRQNEPFQLADMMRGDMLATYPQLEMAKPGHAWSGLMGYALHSMPLIGEIDDGIWMATAFGGHGLNTTAMAGCLIADAISQNDDRYKLFAPYRPKWAGGLIGRVGVQLTYWAMCLRDGYDEKIDKHH
jgi:gamma-glutamylputrescine oxidase